MNKKDVYQHMLSYNSNTINACKDSVMVPNPHVSPNLKAEKDPRVSWHPEITFLFSYFNAKKLISINRPEVLTVLDYRQTKSIHSKIPP